MQYALNLKPLEVNQNLLEISSIARALLLVNIQGLELSLALQTVWLLPILDARAELIIQGQLPAPSSLHTIYVVLEVLKVIALAVYGFWNHSLTAKTKN